MDKELADLKEQARGYAVGLEALVQQIRAIVDISGDQADLEAILDCEVSLDVFVEALNDVGDDSRERVEFGNN